MARSTGPILSLEDASLAHGRRTVLGDVCLSFDAGVVALLGPNGVGKSTLLAAIATLHPLASGTLKVSGLIVDSRLAARRARQQIGYLGQEPDFPHKFTVSEALHYGAWLWKLPDPAKAVEKVESQLHLTDYSNARLRDLSAGTRHRVLLGQAIIHDPRILILDEPTAGMDIEHRALLRSDLDRLGGDRLVILSTHVLDDIDTSAATIVILGGETVAYCGSVDSLRDAAEDGAADSPSAANRPLESVITALGAGRRAGDT